MAHMQGKPRPDRAMYPLVCIAHTFLHTFTQMHIALIPILRSELGINTILIGLMASIPLLIQSIITLPSGLIADRFSRLNLMVVSLLISALGGVLMAGVSDVLSLIMFVSLFSISSTFFHPPALSVVSSLVSSEKRGRSLGIFNSSGTLGISLGPITLSLFMASVGWRSIYLAWSVPAALVSALILFKYRKIDVSMDEQPIKSVSSDLHILRDMSLILLLTILGARAVSTNAINTYITPYFVDVWKIKAAEASLIFGIRPLVGILAAPLGGVMVDRIGAKKWIALGLASQIIWVSLMAFSKNLNLIIFSYLFYSFFGIMVMPAIQYLIAQMTPTHGRGLAYSLSLLPGTLTGAISPITAAFIVDALGIWYIFPFSLTMLFTAISTLGLLCRKMSRYTAEIEDS